MPPHKGGRKKQSCQPKQIHSNRNAVTNLSSPSHSWMNTFISKEESKISKADPGKKTKIKMLRVSWVDEVWDQLGPNDIDQQCILGSRG